MANKKFKSGELIFKEGDPSKEFYLVQSGQVRLYQTKGKGFIELGLARVGDIVGENEFPASPQEPRLYNAETVGETELVIISYDDFQVALNKSDETKLVKTIFNAQVSKVKKLNQKVREFEQNSLSYGEGKDYVYIKDHEAGKILALIFLVGMSFGQSEQDGQRKYNRRILQMYAVDIFGLAEAKIESLFTLLKEFKIATSTFLQQEGVGVVSISNIDLLKSIINFYQAERFVPDEKKVKVSPKCLMLIEKIYFKVIDGFKLETTKEEQWGLIPIIDILEFFKERNMGIEIDELADSKKVGITREVLIDKDGQPTLELNFEKLKKYLPILKFQEALRKLNVSKAKS